MKKAEEYRAHAEECRQLAARGDATARDQLLKMAGDMGVLGRGPREEHRTAERIAALETDSPPLSDHPEKNGST